MVGGGWWGHAMCIRRVIWWTGLERWKSCMLQGATQLVTHLTGAPNLPTTTYVYVVHHKSHSQRLGTQGA